MSRPRNHASAVALPCVHFPTAFLARPLAFPSLPARLVAAPSSFRLRRRLLVRIAVLPELERSVVLNWPFAGRASFVSRSACSVEFLARRSRDAWRRTLRLVGL